MPLVVTKLRQSGFPYQRTHDAVLAATLRHHGVRVFYTRNTKDFQGAVSPTRRIPPASTVKNQNRKIGLQAEA